MIAMCRPEVGPVRCCEAADRANVHPKRLSRGTYGTERSNPGGISDIAKNGRWCHARRHLLEKF